MARFTAGSAVKYIILPGILPRIRNLFFTGFGLLAFYVALVFGRARILPPAHPYLSEANIGKFGLRHALWAGWQAIDFKWKNIDKAIIFFSVLSGVLLLFAYVAGLVFYLLTAPAMAGGVQLGLGESLFTNATPRDDIAFMMLDRMLGIPGIYDSKIITSGDWGQMPTPFHQGLHALFAYFSWGMFVIAVVLMLYFIVDIVLETSNTGTPFGKHFQNVLVPIRLVMGIGLLIPVAYGLNSAQWITLYIAKAGSNFATNGWFQFNKAMENPMGMENRELVALPVTPDFSGLAKDLFTIRACKDVHEKLSRDQYQSRQANANGGASPAPTYDAEGNQEIVVIGTSPKDRIQGFFVNGGRSYDVLGSKTQTKQWPEGYAANFVNLYAEGLRFYKGQDVRIVFGRYSEENLGTFPGGVEPVCGEVVIPNLLPLNQEVPQGNVQPSEISDGLLIGGAHLFAVINMVESITKQGYGDEAAGEEEYNHWLMKAATDRYYYQNMTSGRQKISDDIAAGSEWDDLNLSCPNDSNNNFIDDMGAGTDGNGGVREFYELGRCDGPPANEFYANLIGKYQRFFSYGPLMGYDYYTGRARQALNERCAAIDCSNVVSGAASSCMSARETCLQTRDEYDAYKPFSSVYYRDLGQENPFVMSSDRTGSLYRYGWGGAGIWYKMIAEKNGSLTGATNALPTVTHFPKQMESVAAERLSVDSNVSSVSCEIYNPSRSGNQVLSQAGSAAGEQELARMYYGLCKSLHQNEAIRTTTAENPKSGNMALDVINALLGTSHLFSFRENSIVNPMSQMAALGRALLDKAIFNIMIASGGSAGGGLLTMMGSIMPGEIGQLAKSTGPAFHALGKMVVSFAMVGLTAGVLLYYVLPFMPFMYFFFAVGTWVKTIFEALVGMPLWALAHLRLDESPGFAGKAASGGYFMLFEIFIRPIVTLFALVASLFIFLAVAYVLNITWGIATHNLVGFDPMTKMSDNPMDVSYFRPRVDQLFFTICYIIFMYMTATSTFKLIDMIPDTIMRWINEVKTFGPNDSADQQVGNTTQMVAFPIVMYADDIVQGGTDLAYKAPASLGSMGEAMNRMGQTPNNGGGS